MKFFLEKQLSKFSCTYQSLSFCKILKKSLEPTQSHKDVPFLAKNDPFVLNNFFVLVHTVITAFIYLLALFIVRNLKKYSYSGSRVMRMRCFSTQNGPFAQMRIFSENLLISLVPFIHVYLSCQKSKSDINEILTIKED